MKELELAVLKRDVPGTVLRAGDVGTSTPAVKDSKSSSPLSRERRSRSSLCRQMPCCRFLRTRSPTSGKHAEACLRRRLVLR